MGRPREHDHRAAIALLEAAERTAENEGLDAVSLRRVAAGAGTTTRAVYSLFGSKDGLIIALGTRAFEILGANIRAMPTTDDPAGDLIEAGIAVFRRFVLEHPSLFRVGVQQMAAKPDVAKEFRATASEALAGLQERVARIRRASGPGCASVADATIEFHALCEGLAAVELRGILPTGHEERIWRAALTALVTGLSEPSRSSAAPRFAPTP